ncbi:MAG: NAD-dependent epimerase/dehydratase family protein [Synechocystis sp.]|nr:NAD-dependent epimerase/dehydratase family protein [Synechocystis sp.]
MALTSLVTGVAGFIGSHLAETLLNQGHHIIGIDELNDYYDRRQKQTNLQLLQQYPHFTFIADSIQNLNWKTLLHNVQIIYHQAAQAGVRASWGQNFKDYTERNLNATQIILEACRETTSLQRLVFASSSSVYGNAETIPTTEQTPTQPVSPYGITKLAAEQLCHLYHHHFGVPITSLRYFTVYGPRQRPDMAFHKFFRATLQNQPITILGDGQQTRNYTYVSDIVVANLAAATSDQALGQIINIGGNACVSLETILNLIEKITQIPLEKNYLPYAVGDAKHTNADITLAAHLLNYRPQIDLETGLTKEWQWIQEHYQS